MKAARFEAINGLQIYVVADKVTHLVALQTEETAIHFVSGSKAIVKAEAEDVAEALDLSAQGG